MCKEISYRFGSADCGCVYVHVIACEDARVPVDALSKDAKARWPKCCSKRGVRNVDGGVLGEGCWALSQSASKNGRGKIGKCEKRMKVHVQVKR